MKKTLLAVVLWAAALPAHADDSYEVQKSDADVAVGSRGMATVSISARKGWHLNAEAPLTLKLGSAPGLQTDKPKLGRADLALSTETQARFDVGLTASEPGKKTLEAEVGFVLCRDDACRPIREKISLGVNASEAKKVAPTKKSGKKK